MAVCAVDVQRDELFDVATDAKLPCETQHIMGASLVETHFTAPSLIRIIYVGLQRRRIVPLAAWRVVTGWPHLHFNVLPNVMILRDLSWRDATISTVWILGIDLQNFRHSASVAYSPICHWESGDRMAPLIQHSVSIH
eukprot:2121919-Pleurochrysis_carterae.AAC.1